MDLRDFIRMPVSSQLVNALRLRLRARIEQLDSNASQVSIKAGLGREAVRDILNGKNRNPSYPALRAIAQVLNCDIVFLTGERDAPFGDRTDLGRPIPIAGTVEAGVFTEMSGPEPWLNQDQFDTINAPHNQRYPEARHFAFRVRGDSMNAATPKSIVEGDYLLCVDFVDAGLSIVDGRIYVVRKTSDGGGKFEWTVKRAQVFRDRVDLVPESTNRKHRPVTIPFDGESDSGDEIAVVGLVYGTFAQFE